MQARENVVFQTDKPGRFFTIDSLDNYKSVSQPHIADSNVITKKKPRSVRTADQRAFCFMDSYFERREWNGSRGENKEQYDK